MAYYTTRNTRTRNNRTQNTHGNTSRTPQKNRTLHSVRRTIAFKLEFSEHLESIFKKVGRNVNPFLRTLPYKNFEKRCIFMNFFYATVGFTIAYSRAVDAVTSLMELQENCEKKHYFWLQKKNQEWKVCNIIYIWKLH